MALLAFFLRNDPGEEQPKSLVFSVIGLGALSALVANVVEAPLPQVAVVAVSEELLKFAAFFPVYRHRALLEPYDAIVYAVASHMGFAAAENLQYVLRYGWQTGLARGALSVPAHAMFAVCMGYFLGRARFARHPNEKRANFALALVLPMALHGLYDLGLELKGPAPLFPLMAILWLGGLWFMDEHIASSPFKFHPPGQAGRRVWARFEYNQEAQAGGADVQVVDIGLGGALLKGSGALQPGDLVLPLKDRPLVLGYDVLSQDDGVARVRFVTLNWRTKKRLELLLTALQKPS